MKRYLLYLLLLPYLSLAADYEIRTGFETNVPLTIVGKMMLLPGQVDGKSGYFLLDTGAPELILNHRHFPDHLVTDWRVLIDLHHSTTVGRIQVDSFSVGQLYRRQFRAPVTDMFELERLINLPLLGLLGYSVIKDFEVRIDYYASQITVCRLYQQFNPLRPWQDRPADHVLPFTMSSHLPTLSTRLADGPELRLGLDSGASVNLLHHSIRPVLNKIAISKRSIKYQCIQTTVRRAPYFTIPYLVLQDAYRIRYWRAAVGDLSQFHKAGVELEGILGANFFQLGKVSINYAQQFIRIWNEPHRINHRYVNLDKQIK